MALFSGMFLPILLVFCDILYVNSHNNLIILNENNWTDMLEEQWMVEFFAPWCPACKGLETTWRDFAKWAEQHNIKVGQIDVTASPGLSGRFMVTALPTIFHVVNGEFRQYKGSRDMDSFIQFVIGKKWQLVDPVPYWKSPDSIQMTIVSSFFKLSQILRHIHTKLMDDFGLPTWGSYLIFAIATIFMGALLGLLLVCIIDFIYPPKDVILSQLHKSQDQSKLRNSDDEIGDDIKDDLLDDQRNEIEDESNINESPKIKKRKPRRAD